MHRGILDITEEIIGLLKKNEELSVRQISIRVKSHRNVVLRSLEFLKRIELAEERRAEGNVDTRLFSLS